MTPERDEPANAALRRRLATIGVPLFEPTPGDVRTVGGDEVARTVVELLRSGDPRLTASIPCVFAAHLGSGAWTTSSFTPDELPRIGLMGYVARSLVVSRAPDFEQVLGSVPQLARSELEPREAPSADEAFGARGLAFANERDPALVGDAIRLFDQWLRILRLEHRTRELARTR